MIRAEYWRRHVTEVHKTQEDILLTKDGFPLFKIKNSIFLENIFPHSRNSRSYSFTRKSLYCGSPYSLKFIALKHIY